MTTTLEHYAEINPSTAGIDRTSTDNAAFVPMAAVSEEGRLATQEMRSIVDVAKGYTSFARNDVLMAKITPCMENGKAALVSNLATEIGFGSTEFHVLRARPGVDARFLFYLVWNGRFREEAAKHMTGSGGQKRVPASYLKQVKVPLVSQQEQRRIADILDKADAIRRKRKEAIALTEELLRSAFLEMFGDPVTNPKGWPVEPLGKYLGFVTSGSRGWAEHYSEHGDRFIRSLDVQMDRIADEDAAYVVAPTGAEAERTRVQEEDVLLTITGSKIGRAARAMHSHAGAFISQHVAILRVLPGLDADMLAAFLVSDRGGQSLIARSQYGQTKPGLNLAQIRAFPIAVPPPQVQREIRRIRQQIRTSQSRFVDSLQTSDDLFNALVARAFSGKLSS